MCVFIYDINIIEKKIAYVTSNKIPKEIGQLISTRRNGGSKSTLFFSLFNQQKKKKKNQPFLRRDIF